MDEKIIFSENIQKDNREYIIDVKRNMKNEPFLRITHIEKLTSRTEKQTVIVFKEDIDTFSEILHQAINICEGKPLKSVSLEELRKTYKKAHTPWSEKDDESLEQLCRAKESIPEMCITLQRSPGEIEIRIALLDLDKKYGI